MKFAAGPARHLVTKFLLTQVVGALVTGAVELAYDHKFKLNQFKK